MRWTAPEWWLLLPVLAFAGWYWRHLGLARPLRIVALLLLLALLAGPQLRRRGDGLDVWVLVDRSLSAEGLLAPRIQEWETLLESSRRNWDRLRFLDFADVAILRGDNDREVFPGTGNETRLALAVRHVLAERAPDRAGRILVLSDGFSTEPLDGLAERLVAEEVALDYRLAARGGIEDVQVERIRIPVRVQLREPFLVEVDLAGEPDQSVAYRILRDGREAGTGTVRLQAGRAAIRFTDRSAVPGGRRYRVEILPERDGIPGNNAADAWVDVLGGPRVLLVTGLDPDPLAAVLARQGFTVEPVTVHRELHPGRLSGARVVVFNNVPATRLPRDTLEALDFFVRGQGGGLVMLGGRFSFGSGGWFESPVDPLLPVSMELKEEHKKLAVAMAIVLDRSGSMGAGVSGGPPGTTKMDLANAGAARAIELLGQRDQVTVFAVDSDAHPVIELATVGPNRSALMNATRRIRSGGGGIFVYTGLDAAWEELRRAPTGQRHVILFSDAADSEEPGDYRNLVREMTEAGCTLSVIGLGSETDADAELLKDLAARGGGRILFSRDAAELPSLFAQEAVTVARSAFIEDPVRVVDAGGWMELSGAPATWPSMIDGYNLSYLRDEATAAALSGDEYRAPLVAFWQRGLGRVAAVSFPTGGEFSDAVRAWPGYGDFGQTLVRWLMGDDLPPGIGLRSRLDGTVLQVDLLFDERWADRVAREAPGFVTVAGPGQEPVAHAWERMGPGRYRGRIRLEPEQMVRGAVQIGTVAMPFGPVRAGVNPEWTVDRARVEELATVSRLSGGEERLDLTTVWDAPRPPAFTDARSPVLVALLLIVLADALLTRMGWALPRIAPRRAASRVRTRRARPAATPPAPRMPTPPPAPAAPDAGEADRRRNRFRQARRHHDP